MNVVDSSGWLEFFAGGPNAEHFAEPVSDVDRLVVPVISIYEVFERVLSQTDESHALRAVAQMRQGSVVDLDTPTALHAAELSISLRLPMADALILAAARERGATLWTQDADFASVEGVRYFPTRERT